MPMVNAGEQEDEYTSTVEFLTMATNLAKKLKAEQNRD